MNDILTRAMECTSAGLTQPAADEPRWFFRKPRPAKRIPQTPSNGRSSVSTGAFDAKERVREATDIVELIGATHELRPQGRSFVTHCPFHDDEKPSLNVNPDRQTWKCWPCDKGGDVFSFVMESEGVSFPEALQMLADKAGIEIRSTPQLKAKPGSPDDKKTLFDAVDWAVKQFHDCLLKDPAAAAAREYLQERQLSNESIAQYSVGYAPREWHWILDRAKNTPYSPEVLEAIGLARKSDKGNYYDYFRGRVLFPIRDPQKRAIGVGGRILPQFTDDGAKYYNSPETRLYTKSDVLYGLDVAREDDKKHKNDDPNKMKDRGILVMEGYTDVIMTHQFGIDYVVAVCGTALTERHIKLMKRYTDRITLVLDGDTAGQKKSSSSDLLQMFLSSQVDLRVVTLPEGLDPCDFLLRDGQEAFRTFLDEAPDVLEHKIQVSTRGIDPLRDTHRANLALQDLLSTIAKAPSLQNGGSVQNRLREQQVLNRLSREFRIDEGHLRGQLSELRRSTPTKSSFDTRGYGGGPDYADMEVDESHMGEVERSGGGKTGGGKNGNRQAGKPKLENAERQLFELLILRPDSVPVMLEQVAISSLRTETARQLYEKYADLEAEGIHADLNRLLDEYEDLQMKSFIVGLDEEAHRKVESDFDFALTEAMQRFNALFTETEIREEQASLSNVSEDEGLKMLDAIIRKRREVSET